MQNTKKVVVLGLGYIGLPTAALIASKGFHVHGVDVNPDIIKIVNEGKVHIVEPDLEGLVTLVVSRGFLKAFATPARADVFLIAVPTPFKGDHQPDLSHVDAAVKMIIPVLEPGNLVILESTSPVGTTDRIANLIFSARPELKAGLAIAYCPERVLPGRVLFELEQNDRAIGGLDLHAAEQARHFYSLFVKGELHLTNARTAEMCKLTENAFRDVNIAFANEISLICEQLNINVWELIALANLHPRVNILQPGPGVGGHCIAVDPWFIVSSSPEKARLIRTARLVNDEKPHHIVSRVMEAAGNLQSPSIACFGLAFKANIDDLRESPAVEIVVELARKIAGDLLVVEPNIEKLPSSLEQIRNLRLVDSDEALANSDIVVLLVDHNEFRSIDPNSLSGKGVIDSRGIWTSRSTVGKKE